MRAYRLIALALAFTVCATGAAQADPVSIGTAILTWVGASAATASATIAAGVTVAAAVGEAALLAASVGLSYVAAALRGSPQSAQPGSTGTLQASGITPRTWIAGYGMTAGKLAYVNTWGKSGKTPNAYLTMVIELSSIPCDSLQSVIINDAPVTYGSGSPDADKGYAIPEYAKDGKDYLWVKFYDGTQTAADSFLISTFGTDPSFPYASTRKGIGAAYAIVTALYEPTLFSGFPTAKFILNGARLYDPRKDDTVGGDGDHRFGDQSTWEFTFNPAVIEYNILRGITYGGRWFYGLQNLNTSRLPLASWFAAMNECDLEVDANGGGTELQYRCGGEIAVNVPPVNAIEELNKSCNGRLAEIGGIYKLHVGAAGTPSFSFTDADLLSTEGQTFDQFPSLSDLINAVTASFPDPTQGWEMSPAPGRYSDDYEVADGGRQLVSDIQYNMVPFPEQVQRLTKSALAEARNFRKHTIPLPPAFWFAEPLDFGSWTSARNGYSNKNFRFDLVTDLASLDLVAVITETDPSDYDYDTETDYIPYSSGPLLIQRPAAQAIISWSVEAVTLSGDDGRAKPGIKLEWSTTDIDDVDGVLFEVRLTSSGAVILAGETPHSIEQFQTGSLSVSQNLSANTAYQVRGRYRPISARDTTWSSWLDVTTDDIRIGAIDLYNDAIGRAQLDASIRALNDFVGASTRQLLDKLAQVSQSVAETGLGASTDMQTIRRSIASNNGDLQASWEEDIVAATGPDSALAQDIDSLSASLSDKADASALTALTTRVTTNEGDISTLSTEYTSLSATVSGKADSSAVTALSASVDALGDDVDANADSITDLSSAVGNFSASGLLRISTHASQNGADATIALSTATSSGGSAASGGLFISSKSGVTQIIAAADQFLFTDGTNFAAAMEFVGGTLYAKSAVIPTITSDKLDVAVINASTLTASNVVVTGHLQADTVTSWDSLSTPTAGITTSALNPWGSGATVSVSVDSSTKVLLQFAGSFTRAGGTSPICKFRIYRVGSPDTLLEESVIGGSGIPQCCPFVVTAVDETPTANSGNGHYYAIGIIDSGTTSPAAYNNGTLTAMAGKR